MNGPWLRAAGAVRVMRPQRSVGVWAAPQLHRQSAVRHPVRFWYSLIVIASLCAAVPSFGAEVRVSGTFSNLQYNAEGGDLLGVEILILPAHVGGYVALVQIAEGGGPYSVLVPLKVDGPTVAFTLPKDGPYPGMGFSGVVSKTQLTGTWSDGRKEVLKRGISYWDRPAL